MPQNIGQNSASVRETMVITGLRRGLWIGKNRCGTWRRVYLLRLTNTYSSKKGAPPYISFTFFSSLKIPSKYVAQATKLISAKSLRTRLGVFFCKPPWEITVRANRFRQSSKRNITPRATRAAARHRTGGMSLVGGEIEMTEVTTATASTST